MEPIEIEVRRVKFQVRLDEDGRFHTVHEQQQVRRDSMKELVKALAARLARKKLNIPFVEIIQYWEDDALTVRTGKIVGFGQQVGKVMKEYTDKEKGGKTERMDQDLLRGDTDVKELKRLNTAMKDADKAWEDFKVKHRLKLEWEGVEGEE